MATRERAGVAAVVVAVALAASACDSCAPASPPLLQAPGAHAVVFAADAGALLPMFDLLTRAGVLDKSTGAAQQLDQRRELLIGRPAVLSLLESGAVVLATRVPRGAATFASGEVVVGGVRRAPTVHADAIVRVDGDRALIGMPLGTDATALAGLLEALAHSDPPPLAPPLVADAALHAIVFTAFGKRVEPPLHVGARARGNEILIDEAEPLVPRPILTGAAPPWACAFSDAAVLLSVPPAAGLSRTDVPSDSFTGSLVIALYPPALHERPDPRDPLSYLSLVATGVPRDAAAGAELFATARAVAGPAATVTVSGERSTLALEGRRSLRVVSEPGLFALGVGSTAPVDRARTDLSCAGRQVPLFEASGDGVARIVLPALVTPEVIAKALGGMAVEEALPFARLRGIARIRVEATPGIHARIVLTVPE